MARDQIEDTDGHFGYGELLKPGTVDALLTQHNEHAEALDALEDQLEPQSITGSTDTLALESVIAALVALGLATDNRST